ncbi:MAG: FRG domain-containing protein [Lachnospiraceae bacterium]|nr:FRG domain-containing protein [Lachnospiraceae bacterium]
MITREITTIDELLIFVNELSKQHGLDLWYRGEENSELSLIPSIQRSQKRIDVERFITNDFYIKAKQIMDNPPEKHNYADWVAIMQHYGLPTRMLDWSRSPLIASFFATETYKENPELDASVWVLSPINLNEMEGFGRCIYPNDADTTQEMLLPAFKHNHHNHELDDKILACASTNNNLRMYSQQSNFTVHNSLRRLEDICDENTLYKIIIPRDAKKFFIKSLRVFGITEGSIYPDLEHISKDLRHSYEI